MESDKLICNSKDITYDNGYISLQCENYNIPETFEIDGETLLKKDAFHVSLICVRNILEIKPDIEVEILQHFCNFLQQHEIKFEGFTKEFRLAREGERKSVVALCKVSNLHKFADYLGEKTGITVEPQPVHVTIYTLQPNVGIGLNSPEEMEQKSIKIDVPEAVLVPLIQ
ncbi:hypothetical protein COB18_04015 [Candidatus Kaiserbacteria bacterium]|nr:MAG: hypothetical protein COB18_04015 [Candidatus Kaiserbacteria bacterium]